MGVRAAAVTDDDEPHVAPARAGLGDQAAASEAFVIRMRGDDDEPATIGEGIEIRHGEILGGGEKGVGMHGSE